MSTTTSTIVLAEEHDATRAFCGRADYLPARVIGLLFTAVGRVAQGRRGT
jgi:hypothetical protein